MAYFDDLEIDYTTETAHGQVQNVDENIETLRRLLFMFKLSMNGDIVLLADEEGNVIAISPEFIDHFGWTLEEFQALEYSDFFHADSLVIANTHKDNHLAAPYIARCYNKAEQLAYHQVQGLCVEFDGQHWRMLSFTQI